MGHTGCGLREVHDETLDRELTELTGVAPPFAFGAFSDVEEHVRAQVARLRECPWLPYPDDVRGCVLDVDDGSVGTLD